jgi:hypothetical protein
MVMAVAVVVSWLIADEIRQVRRLLVLVLVLPSLLIPLDL